MPAVYHINRMGCSHRLSHAHKQQLNTSSIATIFCIYLHSYSIPVLPVHLDVCLAHVPVHTPQPYS